METSKDLPLPSENVELYNQLQLGLIKGNIASLLVDAGLLPRKDLNSSSYRLLLLMELRTNWMQEKLNYLKTSLEKTYPGLKK